MSKFLNKLKGAASGSSSSSPAPASSSTPQTSTTASAPAPAAAAPATAAAPAASASIKPIVLYSHGTGPNPWKSVIILEELGLPYETHFMQFPDMKKDVFEKLNPNGRVPAIEDPNTGVTLWESGAINQYLVDQYDKSNSLSYTSSPEKYYVNQWLMFQMSGQGPYYGQGAWFGHFHAEKVDSARERYRNEIKRVVSVLDRALHGKQYLVGDKCTIADLAFIPWDTMIPFIFGDDAGSLTLDTDYPSWHAWHQRLISRPAVKKVLADKQAAMAAGK